MSSLGMPEQYKGDWKEIEVPPLAPEEPEVPAFSPPQKKISIIFILSIIAIRLFTTKSHCTTQIMIRVISL